MRRYVPKVGSKVKLREWEHYRHIASQHDAHSRPPGIWAWFEVLAANDKGCRLRHTKRATDALDPAWEGDVPTEWIEAPIGWQSVYTIHCKDREQADRVVNEWFKRGIHVWASHDLSCLGWMFTPFGAGDVDAPIPPHWKFTKEPVESIPPELCPSCFVVKVYEEWTLQLPETKKERVSEVASLRKSGITVKYSKGEHMYVASRETLVHPSRS